MQIELFWEQARNHRSVVFCNFTISGPPLEDNATLPRDLPTAGGHCGRQPARLRPRGRGCLRRERRPLRRPPRQGREGGADPGLGCDDRLLARERSAPKFEGVHRLTAVN